MLNYKKNPIIYGTLLLSFSGLLCRGMGFFYRLFISQAFGEEAMGIFQLTSPVLMLGFSLTCAGMQTAISRFTAFCLAEKNLLLAKKYMFSGCVISFSLSLLYSLIVYLQAENISIHLLQEQRCAPLLRICALSFPFSSLHACFNGYFYGCKETRLPSFTQLLEQLVRIGSVFFMYSFFTSRNLTPGITLTCIGMFLGETVSFFVSFLYYLSKNNISPSSQRHFASSKSASASLGSVSGQLLGLALPLTLNRVIVNLLQSYEAVSIPARLRMYGYSNQTALSIYGVLTGMALSLVLFPSTFTNSASVLLLPSVSEAASKDNVKQIRKTIFQSVFFSCTLGFFCTFLFYSLGHFLGNLLFQSSLAGNFICQLSFLCPFLYLHTTLSSILNGLKKTNETLFINVLSLFIRLIFTLYFIPVDGIYGYLWGLLLSEFISALFCFYFLRKYILIKF